MDEVPQVLSRGGLLGKPELASKLKPVSSS